MVQSVLFSIAVALAVVMSPAEAGGAKKLKYGDRSAPLEARADQLDKECQGVLEQTSRLEGFPDHITPYNERIAIARDPSKPAQEREMALGSALVVCFTAGGMK